MNVFADAGALSKGGPVIDENAHRTVIIASAILRRTGDESRGGT
jgi:hypothetical protein